MQANRAKIMAQWLHNSRDTGVCRDLVSITIIQNLTGGAVSAQLNPTHDIQERHMKIAAIIARTLLGLAFTVFGLNIFLHFMPQQPMSGPPADFFNVMAMESHYFLMVGFFQVLGGLLTLSGRFTPLGLTILAAIGVNILTFHATLTGYHGIGMGVGFAVLEIFCVYAYRANFAGLFSCAIAE